MLRRTFERTIQQARAAAETGAADALRRLGVAEPRRPAHLTEAQGQLRNRLRAHARALGDARSPDGTQTIDRLIEQAAYVQWHRLLFARFLLERRLLRHPEDGGDLTLLDCREEASALGLADEWAAAAHYTARLLPGVFPPDDPVESVSLAPEHARALRQHLLSLEAAIFAADDSLGWTYQFWRAAEKKAVNDRQVKIGAAELPAVTQLFTEPYMVKFLLHNTLGAWWAGKVLAAKPDLAHNALDEEALRKACALPGVEWDYLRFVREDEDKGPWRPAAGTFPDWPAHAAEITYLDPCCGSGHFLVEAFYILAALRQAEEGLTPEKAARAVLRDNLHGLEIDGRCVQIAAFNVALAAWRLVGGPLKLPVPHIAWVGAPPPLPKSEFVALGSGDPELQRGLAALHDLFRQAPLLGSLIEPTGGDLIDPVRIARVEEMLEPVIELARAAEPERAEGAIAARGMADAATILTVTARPTPPRSTLLYPALPW
ncbi:MAG: DNA methyltransferase, partial [Stellaceae bacterium]